MSSTYFVLLKPSEIRFTVNVVREKFDNGIPLHETLTQLQNGEILIDDIPLMEVVWYQEKWEWYTLNNRRLWVLLELEKAGKCKLVKTRRREKVENIMDYPPMLYGSATFPKRAIRTVRFKSPERKPQVLNSRDLRYRLARKEKESSFAKERVIIYDKEEVAIEYVERRVDVEIRPQSSFSRHFDQLDSYSFTNADKCLEYRPENYTPKSRKKSFYHRYHPYRTQRLIKLEARVRGSALQRFPGQTGSYSQPFVCGIVSFSFWQKKRTEFFQRVYSIRTGRARDPERFADTLYTCGVCFKSFRSRVSLEQHSEDLMHWACVRCGSFFDSPTALGQHKLALGHSI